MMLSRREFITGLGMSAVAVLPSGAFANALVRHLAANPAIQLGCASITWGGKDAQAIQEVGSLGYKGIQLRANVYPEYGSKPEALKDLLNQAKIQMPVFSSGNANINLSAEEAKAHLEKHVNHAR